MIWTRTRLLLLFLLSLSLFAPLAFSGGSQANQTTLSPTNSSKRFTTNLTTLHDSIKTTFERWGKLYSVDPALLAALAYAESGYDPNAFNCKARIYSRGILQVTFPTAKLFGFRDTRDVLFDIDTSIRYACLVLRELMERYNKLSQVISAYNAGKPVGYNTKYVLRVLRKYVQLKYAK